MPSENEFFGPPWVDVDEWREAPGRYRYVHGGFEGTDTRFSVYLPERDAWAGRFVQLLQGGYGGSETTATMGTAFGVRLALENGAYLVESNQGHVGQDLSGLKGEMWVLEHGASATSARYARTLAAEMYGDEPAHGYVCGGSGGAARSIACLERVPDLYDAAIPYMIGDALTFGHNWSVLAWALPVLREKLPAICAAVDAGGSGDPFAALDTAEQRQALATLYRAGYPRGAELLIQPVPVWAFAMTAVGRYDPSYLSDFWSRAGYGGTDDAVVARRREQKGVVARVVLAEEVPGYGVYTDDVNVFGINMSPPTTRVGVVLDGDVDLDAVFGSTLQIRSGAAAGRTVVCTGVVGETLTAALDPVMFRDVAVGDEVVLDNAGYLAYQHLHRHLVDARYPSTRQFFLDGRPLYPQRELDVTALPGRPTGRFDGKMLLLQHAQDRECWPQGALEYAASVQHPENFRLYWIEHAAHFPPAAPNLQTRLIDYSGCYGRAVRAAIEWVERGVEPPGATNFGMTADNGLRLRRSARERQGFQPVVSARADVTGRTARLEATVDLPVESDTVLDVQWDVSGAGDFALRGLTVEHTFDTRGTRICTVRVATGPDGCDRHTTAKAWNLARVAVTPD